MYLQQGRTHNNLYCSKTSIANVILSKYHYKQYVLINVTVINLVTKYRSILIITSCLSYGLNPVSCLIVF